jgi:hypothetical protein
MGKTDKFVIDKNRYKTWRIDEPGASEVCDKNIQFMQAVMDNYTKKCGNPDCKWPISALRTENYAAPEYGDICATCHDIYVSLSFMNPMLEHHPRYFLDLHEAWKKEQAEEIRKKKRFLDGGL